MSSKISLKIIYNLKIEIIISKKFIKIRAKMMD